MLFSALMGMCVLGTNAGVLGSLLQQHADAKQVLNASLFAFLVFALWGYGYYRTWRVLEQYRRESEAIPQAATKLSELAQDVETRLKDGARSTPRSLSPDTPLLDRQVKETWRALRRGGPVPSSAGADGEDRQFPGPEREIRAYMDYALNIGIAGTFVSILITMMQPQGLTAETLLAHVGPGMTSGLGAIIANVGLRLCHRALLDEQDALSSQVDDVLADYFIANLPKSITSPEERVVLANEQLAQSTQELLEYALTKQSAATQKTLAEQAGQLDALLREHARLIGQVLTQQVQHPIQELATHTGVMAGHSGSWAETAADLKAAHTDFLGLQRTAHERQESAMVALVAHHGSTLDGFVDRIRQANQTTVNEIREATRLQIEEHRAAISQLISAHRDEFDTLQREQEDIRKRLTEAALETLGGAIEARLGVVEDRIGATLDLVASRLPDTLRAGIKDGLDETVALIEAVREQAATLTHLIGQISGSADRHLLAYERWQERAAGLQARLEKVVSASESAQESLFARSPFEPVLAASESDR